jgi:putative redox protein
MESIRAQVRWVRAMTFEGRGPSGHVVAMDTVEKSGGDDTAATPKELLLHALGGCTGMDVISILRKMKLEPRYFQIAVEGEVETEPPRAFRWFHIDYRFEGEDLPLASLERAVTLSQEKYCSVSATLQCSHRISWSITVNGVRLQSSPDAPAVK